MSGIWPANSEHEEILESRRGPEVDEVGQIVRSQELEEDSFVSGLAY